MKAKKEMEAALAKKAAGEEEDGLVSARTDLTAPDETLLRISPLTDVVPEPHVKGIRRSWAFLENDPVKIQCRQEDELHTEGSLEMRTMHRLSPLMKVRPKTATPQSTARSTRSKPGALIAALNKPHYRDREDNYGHIGEDGSRGDIRKGWRRPHLLHATASHLTPLCIGHMQAGSRRT